MVDNLHEKPRKELKQLCSQFNIRTAGVKVHNLQSDSFPFHSIPVQCSEFLLGVVFERETEGAGSRV